MCRNIRYQSIINILEYQIFFFLREIFSSRYLFLLIAEMSQNVASTNNILKKIQFAAIESRIFFQLHRANFFEGCGRGEVVLFIQKHISVGDYGGDDDDHDERPHRRRGGREREGRVNGASGRTRSAGFRRLSLPVRRPPSLLPHRIRGSGSPCVRSPVSPSLHTPFSLPLSARREVRSSDPPAFVN